MTPEFSSYRAVLSRGARATFERLARSQRSDAAPAGGTCGGASEQGASILWSLPAAWLLLEDDRAHYEPLARGFKRLASLGEGWAANDRLPVLADTTGQSSDVYWALALHLHLAAFGRHYETLPTGLWGICQDALSAATCPTRWIQQYVGTTPPTARATMVLWSALCLLEQATLASRDVDLELVDTVVHNLLRRPGPGGSLHPRIAPGRDTGGHGPSLQVWTQQELMGLHALVHLALGRPNKQWVKRMEQIARVHAQKTPPRTTVGKPWAVCAFLWSPTTRAYGRRQIDGEACATGQGAQPSAVSGMLLADSVAAMASGAGSAWSGPCQEGD